jgi:hypothetical protein
MSQYERLFDLTLIAILIVAWLFFRRPNVSIFSTTDKSLTPTGQAILYSALALIIIKSIIMVLV